MNKFGLIGFPLTHSFSQKYFLEKFKKENLSYYSYGNFPLKPIENFPDLLKNNFDLIGLNVTIPYKESVMKYLDKIDETAKEVGAVNCIKIQNSELRAQYLIGYNTDVLGFEESLKLLLEKTHKKALVLGSGGGAKAVMYVLKKSGIEFLIVSRKNQKGIENLSGLNYDDLNKKIISEHLLIINTTPLGMSPNEDECPNIPYQFVSEKHLFYDLIYNPEETLFLKKGKERGAKTKNGLEMLHLQAEKSWEIWTNQRKTN